MSCSTETVGALPLSSCTFWTDSFDQQSWRLPVRDPCQTLLSALTEQVGRRDRDYVCAFTQPQSLPERDLRRRQFKELRSVVNGDVADVALTSRGPRQEHDAVSEFSRRDVLCRSAITRPA